VADGAEVAVDPPDQHVDVVAQAPVLVDPLPRRVATWMKPVSFWFSRPSTSARPRPDALADALGVVEPVHAQQQHLGVAEVRADLAGSLHRLGWRASSCSSSASIEMGYAPAVTIRPSGM
jgi:hypothetical protein